MDCGASGCTAECDLDAVRKVPSRRQDGRSGNPAVRADRQLELPQLIKAIAVSTADAEIIASSGSGSPTQKIAREVNPRRQFC